MDYYTVLGVSPDATPKEIKRAYRRRARQTHPDLNEAPNAARQFKRVTEAYEVLSNPSARARYDANYQSTNVKTKQANPFNNVVWSHTVYTTAQPKPSSEPRSTVPAQSENPLQSYWQQAPVRILTMVLMMTLSLALMGGTGAIAASVVTLGAITAGFGLHLYNVKTSFTEAREALLANYRVPLLGFGAVVVVLVGVPGVLFALSVFVGALGLRQALYEWFMLLSILLRLTFAVVSVVIFSSLYNLREEVDRLHGRKY